MRLKFLNFTETKSDGNSRAILPKCPRSAVILLDSNQSHFFPFQSGGYSDAASTRSYGSSHSGGSLGSGSYGAGRTSGAGGYSSGGYDSLPPRPYSTYDTPSSWRSSAYGSGSGAGTYGSSAGYSSGTSGYFSVRLLNKKP